MKNLLFMDLETTGVEYDLNEVVEIACQFYQEGKLNKTFHVHMEHSGSKEINLGALKVNRHDIGFKGYTPRKDAMEEFVQFLISLPVSKDDPISIAGHNVAFDVQGIKEYLKEYKVKGWDRLFSYSVVDTSTTANFLRDTGVIKMDRMSLGALGKALGIDVDNTKTHGAEYDTELTAKCYFKMKKLVQDMKFKSDNYDTLCSLEDDTRHIVTNQVTSRA